MKKVIEYLGYILLLSAFFRVIPFVAAIIYKEEIIGIAAGFFINVIVALLLLEAAHHMKESGGINLSKALILTALAFICVSILGGISYLFVLKGSILTVLLNSLFESVSGFTTTGFTVIPSLEEIPKSIILWRATSQWIGGLGVVVLFIFLMTQKRVTHRDVDIPEQNIRSFSALYKSQGYGKRFEPNIRKTSVSILQIYLFYTLLGIILLRLVGLSLFESIGVTFTSISTGGFAMTDSFYTNGLQLSVISLLMLIGATSFVVHHDLLGAKIKSFLRNIELRFLILLLVFASLLSMPFLPNTKTVVFHLISALTTTGYSFAHISAFPGILIFFILLFMFIGGSMGSTSGGIKLFRMITSLKSVSWLISKISRPLTAIVPFKIAKESYDEGYILIIHIFISAYTILLLGGTLLLMISGYSLFDSLFQIFSALGTVGLSTIQVSTTLPKIILICAMLLGRLEIFPVLVLLRAMLRRSL